MKRRHLALAATLALTAPALLPSTNADAFVGRCPQWETLLRTHAPKGGWDVAKMSKIMARESSCFARARSRTGDTGLLQVNDINLSWLSRHFHRPVTVALLKDPVFNVKAGAALCTFWRRIDKSLCYQPWVPQAPRHTVQRAAAGV